MKVDEEFLDKWWTDLEMYDVFETVSLNAYDFEDDDTALDYCDDWWKKLTLKEKRKLFKERCR